MNVEEILRRLEEIESRAERATPGPWEAKSGYAESDNGCTLIGAGKPIACFYKRISPGGILLHRRDCEFAAFAREDIPWLVGVVRQLVARLEKLEAVAKAAREARDWFRQFGYNEWGIAVKDDFADHETVLMLLEAALTALEGEGGQ